MKSTVTFSGAVLSSLLYDNLKSTHIKEGFLIGEVTQFTTQAITDSSVPTETSTSTINVTSFFACPSIGMFYDGFGNIKQQALKTYLGDHFQNLVGWYRCRGSWEDVYLKERTFHTQLNQLVSNEKPFIFGVFSALSLGEAGFMDTLYVFYELHEKEFDVIPHSIVNMSDTSGSTYLTDVPTGPLYESASLDTALKSISNFEPGVKEIESVYSKLLEKLRELLPQCSEASEKNSQLAEEALRLKALCYASKLKPDFQPKVQPEPEINTESTNSPVNRIQKGPKDSIKKTVANGKKTRDSSREISPAKVLNNKDSARITHSNSPRRTLSRSRGSSSSPAGRINRLSCKTKQN